MGGFSESLCYCCKCLSRKFHQDQIYQCSFLFFFLSGSSLLVVLLYCCSASIHSLLMFWVFRIAVPGTSIFITRIPGIVDNPSFTPPPQTSKLHPAAQSFGLTPSERQSLYNWHKKKCILVFVPGSWHKSPKTLEFPDWGKCLLSFVRSPEEHSCLC